MGLLSPRYVVVINTLYPLPWECDIYGTPNDINLKNYVESFGLSLGYGCKNFQIRNKDGSIPYPTTGYIRENKKFGELVASWNISELTIFKEAL